MSEQPAPPKTPAIKADKPSRPGLALIVLGGLMAAAFTFLTVPRLSNALDHISGANVYLGNEAEKQLAAMAEAGIGAVWGILAIVGMLVVIAGLMWNAAAARAKA